MSAVLLPKFDVVEMDEFIARIINGLKDSGEGYKVSFEELDDSSIGRIVARITVRNEQASVSIKGRNHLVKQVLKKLKDRRVPGIESAVYKKKFLWRAELTFSTPE